jgi:hypothetical protein
MDQLPAFRRPLVSELIDLLTEEGPMRLVAVTGPRQTGKTILVRQAFEELERAGIRCWYVSVDDPSSDTYSPGHFADSGVLIPGRPRGVEWLVATWERARAVAEHSPQGLVMALDEIQGIPQWSNVVKGLWDRDRSTGCPLRVVIMGSAPWELLTGMHESLAGRFNPFPVAHWSLEEMQRAFGMTLEKYIFFGGYPGAASHIGDIARWRGYIRHAIVAPVVGRDILSLTRVEKPSLMRALMELAPEYSGQIVSYRKLQGNLEDAGNTTTLARYLDLLSDAGLVTGLQKHSAKPHLAKRSSPKLNVLNTAIMAATYPYPLARGRDDGAFWGRLCESAVGAHLHNTIGADGILRLRYWREGTHEVDFVLASGRDLVAIEVKSSRRRKRAAGLSAFKASFPGAKGFVVGTGGMPFNEFLSETAGFWFEDTHRAG